MALFNSTNPVLKESAYQGTIFEGMATGQEMTLNGTVNKFGFLFLMMMGSTFFSWGQFYKGVNPMPMMLIGVFGGLAVILIMGFKKKLVTVPCSRLCIARRTICRIGICLLRFRLPNQLSGLSNTGS